MQALLVELNKAKYELTSNHSFQSMGDFEGIACTLEGSVLFESILISWAMDWLASLSLNPDLEVRRGTLSVFSELRAAYSSQKTLHELHFIFTMIKSFLKREFVAPWLTSGSD
jgi:hypothetical protein